MRNDWSRARERRGLRPSRQSKIIGGGAERIALTLHLGLLARGRQSWLAVTDGQVNVPQALCVDMRRTTGYLPTGIALAARILAATPERTKIAHRLERRLRMSPTPQSLVAWLLGHEDFDFALTPDLVSAPPSRPDIIHLHNLHGGYFDLREVPSLARSTTVAVTLHDEWLMTGHCAYTLGCERWRQGCGGCPHLDTYPAVRRDATARNLRVKKAILRGTRLHVSAPSAWLLGRARESVLSEAAATWTVIPNGVDQTVFHPLDRGIARRRFNTDDSAFVAVFVANRPRTNPFKDYETVIKALRTAANRLPGRQMEAWVVGDEWPTETHGRIRVRHIPFQSDPVHMAEILSAADLLAHAAHSDNYPTTILEAQSCGLPVVATAVGGIPEQLIALDGSTAPSLRSTAGPQKATGILVKPGDADAMAGAVVRLAADVGLRSTIAANAREHAAAFFGLERQLDATVGWYEDMRQSDRH